VPFDKEKQKREEMNKIIIYGDKAAKYQVCM
jgi:hypothetical protein